MPDHGGRYGASVDPDQESLVSLKLVSPRFPAALNNHRILGLLAAVRNGLDVAISGG